MKSCISSIGSLRQGCLLIFFLSLQFFAFNTYAQLPELALPSTLSGGETSAQFFGGASADGGSTYSSSFLADQSYEIFAEYRAEPAHVNSTGDLFVVLSLDDQILMQDDSGDFLPWDLVLETLVAASPDKSLLAIESLLVADTSELLANANSGAGLAVFFAYATDSAPGELYFSATPVLVQIAAEGVTPQSETLYISEVSTPIIQNNCIVCHVSGGIAQNSGLLYVDSTTPGYQSTNYNSLMDYIANTAGGADTLIAKPQGLSSHGGDVRLDPGSDDLNAWIAFVDAAFLEISGGGTTGSSNSIFDAVVKTDNEETLRKAALLFAGRLPTEAELAEVSGATEQELAVAIRSLMDGDGFSEFLIESANDQFLTEAFSGNLFGIVDRFYYPNSEPYFMSQGNRTERNLISEALALEPMMLIEHVVSNEKPYTEILTADYIMLNPYSAIVYGGNVSFNDNSDFDEWREGEITEYYRCSLCSRQNPNASYDLATDCPMRAY